MIEIISAILITLIVGPFMFYILSQHYAKEKHLKKYPVGVIDGWGDIVFLPLFNGLSLLVLDIFKPFIASIASLIALILTIAFVIWRKDHAHHNDWSRPRKYVFNNGAWYHTAYMFVQATYIFYVLILYYNNWFLWASLTGYVVMVIIRFTQVKEKVNNV